MTDDARANPKTPDPFEGSFTADALDGVPIPLRVWHVRDLIPARTVTLLSGDGGLGKSTLALQLCCATAASRSWIGRNDVRQGRALYLGAEDEKDEIHRRLDLIGLHYGLGMKAFAGLRCKSMADQDALFVVGQPGQPLQTTAEWTKFNALARNWAPRLIVIDSIADFFGGSEIDRGQARQFIRLLRGVAISLDAAVLLLGHPSLQGLSSGSGNSGSTAWHNSVRSRLYLSKPGDGAAPDRRLLSVKKANYAPSGGELQLRWAVGAFVADGPAGSAFDLQSARTHVDRQFIALLTAYEAQRRKVSDQPGANYAPTIFARDPQANGAQMAAFRDAMNRLFAAGEIQMIEEGPSSRRVRKMVRVLREAA